MNTITLDTIRVRFLKIISIVNLIGSFLLFLRFRAIEENLDFIQYYLFISSAIILFLLSKFPKNHKVHRMIITINPILILLVYAYTNYSTGITHGEIMTYPFFLFPLFSSFLLGPIGGFTLSLLHILIPLAVFKFDIYIFGETPHPFIAIYFIEILSILLFERVHVFLINHIKKVSNSDELTGLSNSNGFILNLSETIVKTDSFYFILVDFDNFSRINTNIGYTLCDEILKEGSEILKASDNILHIARYYGDQFSIIFDGSKDDVEKYLQEKQKELKNISNTLNLDVKISVSAGILKAQNEGETADNIISCAEIALKEAKKNSDGSCHFFSEESLELQNKEFTIQKSLPLALKNSEIEVHFQPQVSSHNESVSGMEALIRWVHPELGYLPPPVFIEIAEKCSMIVEIGEYVIDKSLKHLSMCQKESYTDITVSINISPAHLLAKNFLSYLMLKTKEYNVLPKNIYVEITENIMLEGDMSLTLKAIQNAGFNLSLDDFGTGYSSLNYLREFSFDELKIDKCFTDGLLGTQKEIDMFKTIISIAKLFGMKIVVEGVEEKKQVEMIKEMEDVEIQGWYYSKALESQQFSKFLKG